MQLTMPGRGAGVTVPYSSSLSGGDVGLNGETDVPRNGEGGNLIPDVLRDAAKFDVEVKE